MKKTTLGIIVLTIALFSTFSFTIPDGWFVAGNKYKSYEIGTALAEGKDGKNCATIQSKEKKIRGFATLMQTATASKFHGKRLKMSGYLKVQDVKKFAGFWLRLDSRGENNKYKMLGFDNMSNRKIKGNIDWTKYEIVLDVPTETVSIAYGALLAGTGKIWFDDITFEIVDETVPTTNQMK
ncbi:MAG: hypothetical protein ACEQSR_06250 [Candidatus Methylacidiphilales bacterium]